MSHEDKDTKLEAERTEALATVLQLNFALCEWYKSNADELSTDVLLAVGKLIQRVGNEIATTLAQKGAEGEAALEALKTCPWDDVPKHMERICYLIRWARWVESRHADVLYVELLADKATEMEAKALEVAEGTKKLDEILQAVVELKAHVLKDIRSLDDDGDI